MGFQDRFATHHIPFDSVDAASVAAPQDKPHIHNIFCDMKDMDMYGAGYAVSHPAAVNASFLHAADSYLGYADKCERREQIAQRILNGETQFEVDDDITEEDLRIIEMEVARRYG